MISALLNKRIDIEIGSSGMSSVISPKLTYTDYITIWSGVYVRSGSSQFNGNEEFVYITEFTVRYTPKTKCINNKYRIKYNDKYYKIIEVIEVEPKHTLKIITTHYDE